MDQARDIMHPQLPSLGSQYMQLPSRVAPVTHGESINDLTATRHDGPPMAPQHTPLYQPPPARYAYRDHTVKSQVLAMKNRSHAVPNSEELPLKKRRSSSSSNASPGSKAFKESMILLNSVKIVYPLHEIPEDMMRFIPESQVQLIRPLLYEPSEKKSFIVKKKYATNVDDRTFLSVYEFQINDHWIIWDYHTGYVFFTGLWKAAGNTKTDIVKMVENIPSISSQVRRVRGGFLKIQGTWLPFEACKTLAKNFAFPIRYCLVPLFGPVFPEECLKPGDDHYGKLVDLKDPPLAKSTRRKSSFAPVRELPPVRVTKPLVKKRAYSDNNYSTQRRGSVPILEMEEVLKASKQLHDLSTSSTGLRGADGVVRERQLSFNYGGFVWSWHDNNNLTILGKDEEAVIDDDDDGSVIESTPSVSRHGSTVYKLQSLSLSSPIASVTREHSSPSYSHDATSVKAATPPASNSYTTGTSHPPHTPSVTDVTVPKGYSGFDSILSAAQQLMTFSSGGLSGNSSESSVRETPLQKKVELSGKTQSPKMHIGGLLG